LNLLLFFKLFDLFELLPITLHQARKKKKVSGKKWKDWMEKNMKQNNKITQCWCNSYLENNENDMNDDEAHMHLVQQDLAL